MIQKTYNCLLVQQMHISFFQVLYTRYRIPIKRNSTMASSMDRNVYRVYSAKVNYIYEDWTWSCKKAKSKSNYGNNIYDNYFVFRVNTKNSGPIAHS